MISYRRADTKDIGELVRLRIQFMKEALHISDSSRDDEMAEELRRFFCSMMPGDGFIAWIAEADEQIVGTSGLCFYILPPSYNNKSGGVAYIQNMYTLPEYRGKGIAKILFDKVLMEAKILGYRKITLHATEMGRPVYEKFGFVKTDNEMVLNV